MSLSLSLAGAGALAGSGALAGGGGGVGSAAGSAALSGIGVRPDAPPTTGLFPDMKGPDMSGLPGGREFLSLVQGLEWWALALALAGVLLGAAVWAIGSHSQNMHQSMAGRRAVLVSALAALLIGAAPSLISFCFGAGHSIAGGGA